MKRIFFRGFELVVYDSVYEPREDSFLLAESVSVEPRCCALDMGCGCGIQAINLALQKANVLAVDINERAVANTIENARRCGLSNSISAVQGNLFSAVSGRRFDCIVFNPPYLPSNRIKDVSIDGGRRGYELLHKFLDELPLYLRKDGFCYFVQSSLNGELRTKRKLKKLGFGFEVVARQKLFFEELMVFKAFFL